MSGILSSRGNSGRDTVDARPTHARDQGYHPIEWGRDALRQHTWLEAVAQPSGQCAAGAVGTAHQETEAGALGAHGPLSPHRTKHPETAPPPARGIAPCAACCDGPG